MEVADAYLAAAEAMGPRWNRPDRVPDVSPAALRAWEAREDGWIEALREIDPEALWGRDEWVVYVVLRDRLEAAQGTRVCRRELWWLDPEEGWQVRVRRAALSQPVGTPERRADALTRWRELPRFLDQHTENLREGLRRGYLAPRRNVDRVIPQIAEMIEDSPLLEMAERDGDPEFRARMAALVDAEIAPALRRYRDFLEHEYRPHARESVAVGDVPAGAACYRARVRETTSLDLSPEALHERGTRVQADLERRMREIALTRFGTPDPRGLLRVARTAPENTFGSSAELLEHAEAALDRASDALPAWFGILPRRELRITPLEAGLRPDQREDAEVAGRQDPSRPASLPMDTANPRSRTRHAVEETVFLYGIPGRHLSAALAEEREPPHPVLRLLRPIAVPAGWAFYALDLALEMGLYSSPQAELEVLRMRHRASVNSVVDPGLHALGWSEEAALRYLSESLGIAATPAALRRFVGEPGWLPVYSASGEELIRLRDEARAALGDRFDIREFHDRILEDGPLPLPALRYKIERWIAERNRETGSSRHLGG